MVKSRPLNGSPLGSNPRLPTKKTDVSPSVVAHKLLTCFGSSQHIVAGCETESIGDFDIHLHYFRVDAITQSLLTRKMLRKGRIHYPRISLDESSGLSKSIGDLDSLNPYFNTTITPVLLTSKLAQSRAHS